MQTKFTVLLSLGLMLGAWPSISAQQRLTVGTRFHIDQHFEDSAAKQLEYCQRLVPAVYAAANDMDRFRALAQVVGNLSIIRATWPDQHEVIVQGYLLEADLHTRFQSPRNAIDSMTAALPLAVHTASEALVHMRMARAWERLNETAKAESEYAAAETSLHRLGRTEQVGSLREIALFHRNHNQPAEAARLFRQAAHVSGQPFPAKAADLLASAREAARLADPAHGDARSDLDELAQTLTAARGTAASPSELELLDNIQRDAARLRRQLG